MGLYLLLTLLLFFLAGTYLADVVVFGINLTSSAYLLAYFFAATYLTWQINSGSVPTVDLALSAGSFLMGFGLRKLAVTGG